MIKENHPIEIWRTFCQPLNPKCITLILYMHLFVQWYIQIYLKIWIYYHRKLSHLLWHDIDVKFQRQRLTVQWETRAECLKCNNLASTFTRPHKLVNFHEKSQLISNCSVPISRGNFRNWKMGEERLKKIGRACGGRVRHVGETRGIPPHPATPSQPPTHPLNILQS